MGGRGRDAAQMARARAKRAPFANARDGRVKRQVRWAFWMSRGAPRRPPNCSNMLCRMTKENRLASPQL
jgi:hypothetical protein